MKGGELFAVCGGLLRRSFFSKGMFFALFRMPLMFFFSVILRCINARMGPGGLVTVASFISCISSF